MHALVERAAVVSPRFADAPRPPKGESRFVQPPSGKNRPTRVAKWISEDVEFFHLAGSAFRGVWITVPLPLTIAVDLHPPPACANILCVFLTDGSVDDKDAAAATLRCKMRIILVCVGSTREFRPF